MLIDPFWEQYISRAREGGHRHESIVGLPVLAVAGRYVPGVEKPAIRWQVCKGRWGSRGRCERGNHAGQSAIAVHCFGKLASDESGHLFIRNL